MNGLRDIQRIYTQYFDAAAKAEQKRSVTDGMFGMGRRASDDPCHEQFMETLTAAMEQADAAALPDILRYVFEMPQAHPEPPSVYWMLIAAHGTTLRQIGQLAPADAGELLKQYGSAYRRWERLPVQNDVYGALKKRAAE